MYTAAGLRVDVACVRRCALFSVYSSGQWGCAVLLTVCINNVYQPCLFVCYVGRGVPLGCGLRCRPQCMYIGGRRQQHDVSCNIHPRFIDACQKHQKRDATDEVDLQLSHHKVAHRAQRSSAHHNRDGRSICCCEMQKVRPQEAQQHAAACMRQRARTGGWWYQDGCCYSCGCLQQYSTQHSQSLIACVPAPQGRPQGRPQGMQGG